MSQIEDKIKDIIVETLGVKESEVTHDASFINDLGGNYFNAIELNIAFKKEFGITINDNEAKNIVTVGDAIDYIKKLI